MTQYLWELLQIRGDRLDREIERLEREGDQPELASLKAERQQLAIEFAKAMSEETLASTNSLLWPAARTTMRRKKP